MTQQQKRNVIERAADSFVARAQHRCPDSKLSRAASAYMTLRVSQIVSSFEASLLFTEDEGANARTTALYRWERFVCALAFGFDDEIALLDAIAARTDERWTALGLQHAIERAADDKMRECARRIRSARNVTNEQ